LPPVGSAPLLVCDDLDVAYGSVQVLFGVDLVVDAGEIVALLGTNGAGKSTLLRAVTGLTPPRSGSVHFDGDDITAAEPTTVAARGVSFMPGGRAIFPGLTVHENLELATWLHRSGGGATDPAAETETVLDLFPALRGRLDDRAALLSGGQQQMLALAQSLLTKPRLLLIDELSLGLAPVVVGELIGVVHRLRDEGVTVVVVEQSVNVALELADRAVFMEKGEVRYTGPAAEIVGRTDLLRSVFIGGGDVGEDRAPRRRATPDADPEVHVRGLRVTFGGVAAIDDLDLDVATGHIVGIIGPNGAGKTTLLDALSGFVHPSFGRISFDGIDITDMSVEERAWLGIARTFQDARLFPGLTVAENLAVALDRFTTNRDPVAAAMRLPAALLSEVLIEQQVDELIELLGLAAFRDKHVSQLSTGSRRIVELGSLVAQRARLMLLDEPSAGIAQKEAEALGPLLVRMRDVTGATLVIVEHDIPLLSSACDAMVAMDLGRVIATGTPDAVVRDPAVVESYLGSELAAIRRSGGAGPPAGRTRPLRAPHSVAG
jgi:branched-chain amino acid transport system ATP-binding protein